MEDIAPFIVALVLFGLVPIVIILLKHQEKMTRMYHERNQLPPVPTATDPILIQELSRLRDVVAQQTIALDSLTASHQRLEAKLGQSNELLDRMQA
ncbi:MAG: hypothetical protein ACAH95_18440 [Fimbriimonas sp.]